MKNMIKLWIDDIRPMPEAFTHHCLNASSAIEFIQNNATNIVAISLDHDLSEFNKNGEELTGNTVAQFIEESLYFNNVSFPNSVDFYIHSSNPTGRKNIIATINNASNYTTSKFSIFDTPYETYYMAKKES